MNAPETARIQFPFADTPGMGEAIEIAEGVLWSRMPLWERLDHVNVYAFDEGDSWTVVDTGIDTPATREAWGRLLAGPMAGRPVTRLVVTHHHCDHVGLAGWFQRQGAELLTSRTSWLSGRMMQLDVLERPTAEQLLFWTRAGMDPARVAALAQERPFNQGDHVHPMPLGHQRLQAGDRLRMGGREWQVHMGDGHAPEHVTLWQQDGHLVVTGDHILPGISANIGVHAAEPLADPLAEWLLSCRHMADLARPDQLALPGHKRPFIGLPHRLRQLMDGHHAGLDRLRDWLDQPRRTVECFMPLFRREIEPEVERLALVEAQAHLNHLMHAGEARRELGEDGAWRWMRS